MPFYITQVSLHTDDGVAANYSTNTFSIFADDVAALTVAHGIIADLYDDFRTYFSSLVAQNGHTITSYSRIDPTPRAPVLETTFNFTSNPTGAALPTEVAICLSFQGDRVSGTSQARRRGRVYLGPLNDTALSADGRPSSLMRAAVAAFGDDFLTASDAAAAWQWFIYSTVDNDHVEVTNGWVDNEFDTQRRRGREYTLRTTFP